MVRSLTEYSAGMRWVKNNFTQTSAMALAIYTGTFTLLHAKQEVLAADKSEQSALTVDVFEVNALLKSGDADYTAGDYGKACESYQKACGLLKNTATSNALRLSAVERFAQAAVEQSVALRRVGRYDEAKQLLQQVLNENVAPNHKGAKLELQKLDDPIRTNPALTVEIAREAESAGKWLRKAEGYYNLGQFDEAIAAYEEVLLIDRYNHAARRGMERVNQALSKYYKSAQDQGRATALNQVNEAWELKDAFQVQPQNDVDLENQELDRLQQVRGHRLTQTMIPVVDFQDVTLTEVYETIREWSHIYAPEFLKQSKDQGVNFVINLSGAEDEVAEKIAAKRFSLNLKNIPLSDLLDFISKETGTQWAVGDHAVQITPNGVSDQSIRRRTFTVPPTFLLDAKSTTSNDDDPFADNDNQGISLGKKVSAQEFLTKIGVTFPEGTSAKYIPSTNSLIVRNTGSNMELVESYVNSYNSDEQLQVVMKVTFIETKRENLKELGFDWLVSGQGNTGSNVILGGGSVGNGLDIPSISIPQNAQNYRPISSGLRSGDSMFTTSSIDSAINGTLGGSSRSPGILALTGRDFQVIMRGIDQKGDSSRMDTSTLITRAGHKATFFSGREFIYPTEYEPPELPNSVGSTEGGAFPVTPAHPTAFETRNVGFSFEAEATVSEDKNYIDVNIKPQRVDFEGFVNYGTPIRTAIQSQRGGDLVEVTLAENEILQPVFKRIDISGGNITVQDGAHFVMAGLTETTIETVEDKIPVLGDAPLVGRLFKSEAKTKVERVLLVIVNVELKDPLGNSVQGQL